MQQHCRAQGVTSAGGNQTPTDYFGAIYYSSWFILATGKVEDGPYSYPGREKYRWSVYEKSCCPQALSSVCGHSLQHFT